MISKRYIVNIHAPNGQTVERTVIAKDKGEARKIAEYDGHVASIKQVSQIKAILEPTLNPDQRILILLRLATMVESRVQISRALSVLSKTLSGVGRSFIDGVLDQIGQNKDFLQALEAFPQHFPPATLAMLKAGFQSGDMVSSLKETAEFENEMLRVKKSSMSGFWGAIANFIIGAVLIIVTAWWFGPFMKGLPIFNSGMVDMGKVQWAFTLSNVTAAVMAALLFAVFLLFFLRFIVKPINPVLADTISTKIPFYRDIVLMRDQYLTFYSLSRLILSGVRIRKAIDLSADLAPKGATRADLERASDALSKGQSWTEAMIYLSPTDRASLTTSMDRTMVARSLSAIAEEKRALYGARMALLVPTLSMIGNLLLMIAGILMFAILLLPAMQLTQGVV